MELTPLSFLVSPITFALLVTGTVVAVWMALAPWTVPPRPAAPLTWTGSALVVTVPGTAHLYDPVGRAWTQLALPAALATSATSVAWTGEDLVFVTRSDGTGSPARSAAWNPEARRWRELGPVPVAPSVTAALGLFGGSSLLSGPDGDLSLIWTGTRLLDLSHGAVLDPGTWTWTELAMPGDLVPYTALLYTTPVWTGREVVMAAWSTRPGLAWSADGSAYREVPGMPREVFGPDDAIPDATATRLGSGVLVQANLLGTTIDDPSGSGGGTPVAAVLDPSTGAWTAFEAAPAIAGEPWCWPRSVTIGADTVVASTRCEGGVPSVLIDGAWTPIPPTDDARPCCAGTWTVAGSALVVWESDTDTGNNPEAPYVRARVWIPPPAR